MTKRKREEEGTEEDELWMDIDEVVLYVENMNKRLKVMTEEERIMQEMEDEEWREKITKQEEEEEEMRIVMEEERMMKEMEDEEEWQNEMEEERLREIQEDYECYKSELLQIFTENGVFKLYQFTDRSNVPSIKQHGILSHVRLKNDHPDIPVVYGSSQRSRTQDILDGYGDYVRLSCVKKHPMLFTAEKEGRITDPVILVINLEVVLSKNDILYSDMNATKKEATIQSDPDHLHFELFSRGYFDGINGTPEQDYYQAEVMVRGHIPPCYISDIKEVSEL